MVWWRPVSSKLGLWAASLGLLFFSGCELEEGWPWVRNMFDFPAPGPQEEAFRAPEHTLPVEGGELRDFPEGGLSMPDYREELGERDRWLVIRYLRRLQAEP